MESVGRPAAGRRLQTRARALHPADLIAASTSAIAAAVFAGIALVRYASFNSTAFDLGFFDQVIWETARGHPGQTSYLSHNFFGQHVEPILYLYGALYKLWADPRLLLLSQALAVGAAAWLLFRCTRRVAGPWASVCLSVTFLLAVPLQTALAFDFHPEVVSCLPLFAGLLLALRGRLWAAAACWCSLLLFKEDEALILPGLGLLLFFIARQRAAGNGQPGRRGLLPVACCLLPLAGLVWAALAVGIVEPHWRHGHTGDLTLDYIPVIAALGRPAKVVSIVFGNGGLAALARWIGGMGLAPLLAPVGLVAAAPQLLLHLASENQAQHILHLHYGVETVPLVFASLLVELGWLRRRPQLQTGIVAAVAVATLAGFALGSPFRSGLPFGIQSAAHLQALKESARLVPPDAVLRADSTLAAHLSQREQIFEFPGPDWGTYVALDANAYHPSQSLNAARRAELDALPAQGYAKIYDREGVQLWKR